MNAISSTVLVIQTVHMHCVHVFWDKLKSQIQVLRTNGKLPLRFFVYFWSTVGILFWAVVATFSQLKKPAEIFDHLVTHQVGCPQLLRQPLGYMKKLI